MDVVYQDSYSCMVYRIIERYIPPFSKLTLLNTKSVAKAVEDYFFFASLFVCLFVGMFFFVCEFCVWFFFIVTNLLEFF